MQLHNSKVMKKSIIQFFLFLTIIFIGGSLLAQDQTPIDSTTQANAINMANISTEIQTTNIILEPHFENDFDKSEIAILDSTIVSGVDQIKKDYEKIGSNELANISKASLDALEATWNLNQTQIEKGLGMVKELFEENNSDLIVLKEQEKKWKATLQVFESEETPEEMLSSIRELIKTVEEAEVRLSENLSNLVLLETKINEVGQFSKKVQDSIKKAQEERSKDVFRQNAPVFWKLLSFKSDSLENDSIAVDEELVFSETDTMDVGSQYFVHWSKEKIKFSNEFVETNQNTIYFHIFLWLLTLVLTYRVGKYEISISETGDLTFAQEAMFLIRNRLIVAASYISILYASFLYDFLPALILEVLVVILIMMNVLIHFRERKKVLNISLILSALYISTTLSTEVWFEPLGYRIYLFLKLGLVYWVMSLFSNYWRTERHEKSPTIWRELYRIKPLVQVVLGISVVANLFGFVKLSEITILLVTQTLVVSYIFYGILITSNGIVTMVFTLAWVPKGDGSLKFRNTLEGITLKIVNFFASLFWIKSILTTVGIYDPLMDWLIEVYSSPAEFGSVSISLKEITYGVIVFIITYAITKFIGIVIKEGGLDRFKLKRGVPNAVSLVVRYTIFGLGFMLALSVAGIDLSSFSLMAGALGIGIGFGLQNIISNFVSGLILVFERPLQEGDVVEVNSLLGIVKNIGIRSSNIRTYTGSEVVVPNESLISKELINWTLSDPHKRMEILIGVDYGSDPRQIIKLLTDAALENTDVKRDPAPIALFEEFGDSSLNFRLLFWVHHSIALGVKSDVMLRVSDTMRENNINIPFPIRTLMVDKGEGKTLTELLPDQRSDENINAQETREE